MNEQERLEKIYKAGQKSYKASSDLSLVERYLQKVDEPELREEAMRLMREVKALHREIDAKVGGKQ